MPRVDLGDESIALVVDDNPDSLGMVSAALEQQGMTVLIARDGHSAIRLTQRVNPDVILLDAMMPELDGFETCRLLKSGPNPTLAPIIFMTGLTDREHVVKGLQAGGVDYITKPVQIEEMIARLSTHVANSRLLQSARQAIDAMDRSVLAFASDGTLAWGSSQALEILDACEGPGLDTPCYRDWVRGCIDRPVSSVEPFETDEIVVQFIGFSAAHEILVKLVRRGTQSNEALLSAAFDLTLREAEVLYWLSLGKTNRDIGAILSLSARTVNKHLEQIFQKMGVDNRTSAAVLADRKISAKE